MLTATGLAALRRDLALPEACWQSVSRAGWWLPAVFWSLFALLVTGLLAALIGAVALCLLLALPLVIGCLYRRWRRLGFYRDHQWLAVRTGLIGSCERWLPAGKLQKITLRQSPLARRLGLATVCVWGADGRLTIAWVPEAQALRLRDGLLSDVVTFKSPWF